MLIVMTMGMGILMKMGICNDFFVVLFVFMQRFTEPVAIGDGNSVRYFMLIDYFLSSSTYLDYHD